VIPVPIIECMEWWPTHIRVVVAEAAWIDYVAYRMVDGDPTRLEPAE
jgi:hypothetical protein